MEQIIANNKKYQGELIYKNKVEGVKISIYVLNFITEKYLVLRQKEGAVVNDFIVTGIEKVYELISLLDVGIDIEDMKSEINKRIVLIEEQSYMKTLKKINENKFKRLISQYYNDNYPIFAILGIKKSEIIEPTTVY